MATAVSAAVSTLLLHSNHEIWVEPDAYRWVLSAAWAPPSDLKWELQAHSQCQSQQMINPLID